ncbi:leucine--tRNA ligase [Candidatus Berkelbacteria bacterium]|nr:leucine--tRNA ligase [Candidatus Berkelbacteria bacterium]
MPKKRKKFYHLVMFPYPSGDLHIGHWYNFAPADIYARFKYLQGFNVLSPIGFDAFGLPAENAAIRYKMQPKEWTKKNIARMKKQIKSIGAIYDWSREINTSNPDYYKWTQWFFIQFYKKGLAYRAKVKANWCPSCQTVLANEQVLDSRCERCDTQVEQKEIEQWLFLITKYADRLLTDLDKLNWPEKTKIMQKNWIGKSEGAIVKFPISNFQFPINVFTTRADTLFGTTYLVLSPEHAFVAALLNLKTKNEKLRIIEDYIQKAKKKTERERIAGIKDKTGVFTGLYALNPVNNEKIPIWIADYVLASYGTGAIMAVPAHDQRDFEFAQKYQLPIKPVINSNPDRGFGKKQNRAFEDDGWLINSGEFSGLTSTEARKKITTFLQKKNLGKAKTEYHLRDWLISRQRYWGVPIPMIDCPKCGWQTVLEKDLPVLLPPVTDFKPKGKSPLATNEHFVNTKCPSCQGPAKRETDTMDTFVDSSWYFIRYTDPKNQKRFAASSKIKYWLPVDIYIGGAEHTVMHLLYARFFTKALYDMKLLPFDEPFPKLRHQGIILGQDRQKMSKSRGNVVDPDELVKKYGADAVRMFMAFMGPYDQGGPWNSQGIMGVVRYLNRVKKSQKKLGQHTKQTTVVLVRALNSLIKKITKDIENLHFNTAVSSLMKFQNLLEKENCQISKADFQKYLTLLHPFAPHLASKVPSWPSFQIEKTKKFLLLVEINGKVKERIEVSNSLNQKEAQKLALNLPKIKEQIRNKKIKKTIFLPRKLINFVTNE